MMIYPDGSFHHPSRSMPYHDKVVFSCSIIAGYWENARRRGALPQLARFRAEKPLLPFSGSQDVLSQSPSIEKPVFALRIIGSKGWNTKPTCKKTHVSPRAGVVRGIQ
jgi:hypothetical protein